jgi:hypothetical protein
VDVEIAPEPTDEERRAILAALEAEAGDSAPPSAWQRQALGPAADEDQAVAPPRQSRGATRA